MDLGSQSVARWRQAQRNWNKTRARTWAHRAVREGLFDGIDETAIREITREFRGHPYLKYYDRLHHTYLRTAERIFALGLHRERSLRILDVGTGFGLFPYAARELGHRVVGLDRDDPFFEAVACATGIERVVHEIQPFEPLPTIPGTPFQLVTAFATCFDRAGEPGQWGVAEWGFFLRDLARQLTEDSRLYLKFNQYRGGGARPGSDARAVPDVLADYFVRLGGRFYKRAMDLENAAEVIRQNVPNKRSPISPKPGRM